MTAVGAGLPLPRLHGARLSLLGDDRLAALAARGDASAFATIFARYQQPLVRYCAAILGSPHDANDAVQNAMISALRGLPRREADGPLRPWLYRIAHNEAISVLRTRRGHVGLDDSGALAVAAPELDDSVRERVEALFSDLRELPERQRGALLMRELCGLGYDEIALALGGSAGAARQTVFEARVALGDIGAGRDEACETVRRTISAGDRRALRARRLRGHLRSCENCRGFEATIDHRRRELAALAPWLSGASLAGAGTALGGGGTVAGTLAGGTAASLAGGASIGPGLAGGALAFKGAVAVVVAVTVAGGAVELERHTGHSAGSSHPQIAAVTPALDGTTTPSSPAPGARRVAAPRGVTPNTTSYGGTGERGGVTVDLAAGSVKTAPRPSAKAPSHAPGSEMVASTPKAPKPAPTGSSTTGTTVSTPAPSPPATPVSTTSPSSGSTTSGPAVTPATGSTPGSSASSASYHLPGIPTAAQILAIVHGAAPYVPPGVDDLIRNTYPFK